MSQLRELGIIFYTVSNDNLYLGVNFYLEY